MWKENRWTDSCIPLDGQFRSILPSLVFLLLRGMRGNTLTRFFDETSIRQEPRGCSRIKADTRSRVQRQDHVVDRVSLSLGRDGHVLPRNSRFDFISPDPWFILRSIVEINELSDGNEFPCRFNVHSTNFARHNFLIIPRKKRRREGEIRATVRLTVLTLPSRSDWPVFVSQ